jgi:hypothetical protein
MLALQPARAVSTADSMSLRHVLIAVLHESEAVPGVWPLQAVWAVAHEAGGIESTASSFVRHASSAARHSADSPSRPPAAPPPPAGPWPAAPPVPA